MSELIQLSQVGEILSNVGNKLITNQTLLKCIKYDLTDALLQPDLQLSEIIDLIGKGSNPISQRRIFNIPFTDQIVDEVRSELRFYLPLFKPNNIYLSEVIVAFQIIVHNTLWNLDDNKSRPIIMLQEILSTLNGFNVEGIGELQLNDPARIYAWNSHFSGYMFQLKTRTR